MNKQKNKREPRSLDSALSDILLEASDEEIRKILEQEGENVDELASRAMEAVKRAERQVAERDAAAMAETIGVGPVVALLRRKKGLSHAELAERAFVAEEEVLGLEQEPGFSPRPRTLAYLEDFFRLKPRVLAILAGEVRIDRAEVLRDEVKRYAANSTGIGRLTKDEKRMLNAIVKAVEKHVR